MSAVDLAAWRAARDDSSADGEPWTLDRHATDPDGSSVFAEIAERLARIERRLSAMERRTR